MKFCYLLSGVYIGEGGMIMLVTMTLDSDTLVYLGRRDINRNDPICVASARVAKASKDTCHCSWRYHQQMLPM